MAMPNIHMVQRLQGRIDEVVELVVVDCYGKKKQHYLLADDIIKEKKQEVSTIQCAVRRPCKDLFSFYAPPFVPFL